MSESLDFILRALLVVGGALAAFLCLVTGDDVIPLLAQLVATVAQAKMVSQPEHSVVPDRLIELLALAAVMRAQRVLEGGV